MLDYPSINDYEKYNGAKLHYFFELENFSLLIR